MLTKTVRISSDEKIEGFKKGLQWLFKEYKTDLACYDLNSSEYDLFLATLPEEEVMNIIHLILYLSLVD